MNLTIGKPMGCDVLDQTMCFLKKKLRDKERIKGEMTNHSIVMNLLEQWKDFCLVFV